MRSRPSAPLWLRGCCSPFVGSIGVVGRLCVGDAVVVHRAAAAQLVNFGWNYNYFTELDSNRA